MLVISLLVFFQVLSRFVFHFSTPWLEDIMRLLMVWMVLIVMALAVRMRKHIVVDIIDQLLKSKRLLKIYNLSIHIIGAALSIFLIYLSVQIVTYSHDIGVATGTLRVPMSFVYSSFLLGSLLMFLHYIEQILLEAGFLKYEKAV